MVVVVVVVVVVLVVVVVVVTAVVVKFPCATAPPQHAVHTPSELHRPSYQHQSLSTTHYIHLLFEAYSNLQTQTLQYRNTSPFLLSAFLLDCLTTEDGTLRLSRKVAT